MAKDFDGPHQYTVNQIRIVDLPLDVLYYIFKYCDSQSLRNLCITCKKLSNVVSEDCVWLKLSNTSVITNQLSGEVLRRCCVKLRPKDKCRISTNWKHGCYKEKIYKNNIKYMPWLLLEANKLWVSRGNSIMAIQRHKGGLKMQTAKSTTQTGHTEDISRFAKANNIIYSGGKDKFICAWSAGSNKLLRRQYSNHLQPIQGLDCKSNILVTGSKDSTVKVWQIEDFHVLRCVQTVQVMDRVWCVAIDPSLCYTAAGSAGYSHIHPFHLYDLSRGCELPITRTALKAGAAMFDIRWECPNTVITCGFDTVTRLWDIRLGKCVSNWVDPFGAAGYCLESDQSFSIFCGTARHGRVQLWDKRSPLSVQAYFGRSEASSPVYSIGFDSSQLLMAQDSAINLLDFSVHSVPNSQRADYSAYWITRPRIAS